MKTDDGKEYIERFYLVTFTDDGEFFLMKTNEIDEPPMAEVTIPCKSKHNLYAFTCYITNYPNWQPAIIESIILKEYFETTVDELEGNA